MQGKQAWTFNGFRVTGVNNQTSAIQELVSSFQFARQELVVMPEFQQL
jgi:hypothetical protein